MKADPSKSRVGFLPGDTENVDAPVPPPVTGRHIAVLIFVTLTFAIMIFAIIPWSQIFGGIDADPYGWELGWGFGELSAWFILAAIIVGPIGGPPGPPRPGG